MRPYQHACLRAVDGVCLRGYARPLVPLVSFGYSRGSAERGALWSSIRYHLVASTRVSFRGWRERDALQDRLADKRQCDAPLRGHRARDPAGEVSSRNASSQGRRGGSFSWARDGRGASLHSSPMDRARESHVDANSGRDTLAEPQYTFWKSLRFNSRRQMPFNPLHQIRKWSDRDESKSPTDRSTSRFLKAIEEMFGKNRKRGESMTMHLSEDQRHEIVARYASTKWWGRLYYPFRNISDRQIKWTRRIARVLIVVSLILAFAIILFLYSQEVRVVELLSSEDRRDYIHIVNGMRYGEIRQLAEEVLAKEDPLMVLTGEDRCHLFLEAAREKGWHRIDWEVEARNRYPRSALDDFDWAHLVYWLCMMVGSFATGGSTYFTDTLEVKERTRRREMELSFVESEPKALPQNTKRRFW